MALCCFVLWLKWLSSWAVRYLIACLVYYGLELLLSRYVDMKEINSSLGAFFQPGKYIVSIVIPKIVARMMLTSLGYETYNEIPDEALAGFQKLIGKALPVGPPTENLLRWTRLVL